MEKDPICGMQVDPQNAAATSQYDGKTWYFCSAGCKKKFEQNPAQYAKA
jgi:P-type Cu+ transporter